MDQPYANQEALLADAKRRNAVEGGAAAINITAGSYFDMLLVLIAAAFRIHLGKQFDARSFVQEVGRLRFRKLPMIPFVMTDAVGVFANTAAVIEAPSDRHQLILAPAFEFSTVAAGVRGPFNFQDAQLIDAEGRLEVNRPQSDSVPEALSDYSMGSQQFRFDNGITPAETPFEMNRQSYAGQLPWGIEHAIQFSFAALPKLNRLELAVNNLTGQTAPSALQIDGNLHTYVIDCIMGGN